MSGYNSIRYFLLRYVLRRPFLVADAPVLQAEFRVKTEDVIGRHIYKRGIYDPVTTNYLRSFLKPKAGDVILDIGANIGWYSALFDRISPEGVDIFAFEPEGENFTLLKENISTNRLTKVTPLNFGLAASPGPKALYLYPDKNRGRHSLLESSERVPVMIETSTLDLFWDQTALGDRRLRFIKLDVEGYEAFVIDGGREVLLKCDQLLMEFAPPLIAKAGVDAGDLCHSLMSSGLHPHVIGIQSLESISAEALSSRSEPLDVLWIRDPVRTA